MKRYWMTLTLKSNTEIPPKANPSSSTNLQQKEAQNGSWQQKYFVHGDSSDIVADVQNQIHGCINSSVSEDIDVFLSSLHDIATAADKILHDRLSKISSMEEKVINQLIQERQDIINKIIIKGRLQMDQSEEHYRKIIEEFIAKLQIEMSIHLDSLQKQMEAEKQSVFSHSNNNIKNLTIRSQTAKKQFLQILQAFTESKREEVLDKISDSSMDKTRQPLSYEQLRKLNLEMYSTVGIKKDGEGCDNIPDRNKFIKDINDSKPNHTIKRTIYIGNNGDSTLGSRKQNP
ncbi:unnamed protein product [Rotaria sordida]|uniref:Uncharacterized protein n=3 Tax=Rotaria sordida TaxID=392033 RepID=A0A819NZ15_9BILA|nr:unnamed protein product [Rotaria sordida]